VIYQGGREYVRACPTTTQLHASFRPHSTNHNNPLRSDTQEKVFDAVASSTKSICQSIVEWVGMNVERLWRSPPCFVACHRCHSRSL